MIELPEGVAVTIWCSLYCQGNEAIGDITIEFAEDDVVNVPVCESCRDKLIG